MSVRATDILDITDPDTFLARCDTVPFALEARKFGNRTQKIGLELLHAGHTEHERGIWREDGIGRVAEVSFVFKEREELLTNLICAQVRMGHAHQYTNVPKVTPKTKDRDSRCTLSAWNFE